MEKKLIIHLCADIGSDTRPYQLDDNYQVILIGKDIGVENYKPPKNRKVHGVFCNPVCTGLTTVHGFDKKPLTSDGMFLVNHCLRIIKECNPTFWVLESPAKGILHKELGKPVFKYQPWEFGSPWTKQTALWGNFNIPNKIYKNWEDVPNKLELWKRKDRNKPCLAYLHKNDVYKIPEFHFAAEKIESDMDLRSMCSQGFAKAFYEVNK